MRLVDKFTTRDGSWEPDASPYSITRAQLDNYGHEDIPGKGGANHIFVKASPGDTVRFMTSDGENPNAFLVGDSRWVNLPLFHSSSYAPARGEKGPWEVYVNNDKVADGIGLPDGLHVSTFLVIASSTIPSEPPPTPPAMTALEAIERAETYLTIAKGLL